MLIYILSIALSSIISGIIIFVLTKKWNEAHYLIYIERAKARASAIEKESFLMLDTSRKETQKEIIEFKQICELEYQTRQSDLIEKENLLEKKIEQKTQDIEDLKNKIKQSYDLVDSVIQEAKRAKIESVKQTNEALQVLSQYIGFTENEAKNYMLKEIEKKHTLDIARQVRKSQIQAQEDIQHKVNYILAQATSRFAYEFVNDRLINKIKLENDDLKGRIIGKDGRNIYTLENLLGVDIIIDNTPNTIIVSSFNLYRRAIATRVIEILVEDGRVQPSRIEDTFKSVSKDFEDKVYQEGQKVVLDLGIEDISTELVKLIGKLKYRSSFGQNALEHSIEVAYFASTIAGELGGDMQLARRAGILHDIGKALTNDKAGSHIDLGAEVCRKNNECAVVINAIYAHHELEEALSIECAAVCAGDVLSAARPGARKDIAEVFTSRLESIEKIAYAQTGVLRAYAIDAGRELRIIVNAKLINDAQTFLVAKKIAEKIEKDVQYPGKIKVSVIREIRSIKYAL